MHSRAYLLIEKEVELFQEVKPWGIELIQSPDKNNFVWYAKLKGLEQTVWEGGVFGLSIIFSEYYSDVPPLVNFCQIPFHPNVDPDDGFIAMPMTIDPEVWNPEIRLTELLKSVQNLLAIPNKTCIANKDAYKLFRNNTSVYNRLVQECVQKSLQIDEESARYERQTKNKEVRLPNGLVIEFEKPDPEQVKKRERERLSRQFTSKINFDDYLATWSGIATSKVKQDQSNPHLKLIQNKPNLISVHNNQSIREMETQLVQQMEQHRAMVYGLMNFKKPPESTAIKQNIARIDNMRKLFSSQRSQTNMLRQEPSRLNRREPTSTPIDIVPEDIDNEEVDELLKWSESLDQTSL